MKKTILSLSILVATLFSSQAQIADLGNPPSWSVASKSVVNFEEMPAVDVQEQLDIDAMNKANGFDKMLRFGFEHHVATDIFTNGQSFTDPNGNVITRYGIECPEALSINIIFDEFELAEGAELYVYNDDKSQYIGAHTAANNNENRMLGVDLIKGSKMVVEVFEPANVAGQSTLVLGTIVHGYLSLPELIEETMKGLNDSGDCNVDVNCPAGAGWENQRNSVGMLVNGSGFCSGSLVNSAGNTVGNITPYFLTANHCGTDVGGVVFRFRWESPENGTSCATTGNSTNGPQNMNVNGAMLRAANGNADFILVELNSNPNPDWGIYYNGFDISDAIPTSAAGIHHPSGDIKKIAIENQAPTKQTTDFNGTASARFWRIADWDVGVTEPGSSGSPLFDQNRRTIGVLSAGAAACNGTNDNNQYDIYGRLGIAWDELPQNSNQLKFWLDPNDETGGIAHGFDPVTGENVDEYASIDSEKELGTLVSVFPNPTNGMFAIEFNNELEKEVSIVNSLGQTVQTLTTSNTTLNVDGSELAKGVYFVKVASAGITTTNRVVIK